MACAQYKSQSHRKYMTSDYIKGLAAVNGVKSGVEYAELFEPIRFKF